MASGLPDPEDEAAFNRFVRDKPAKTMERPAIEAELAHWQLRRTSIAQRLSAESLELALADRSEEAVLFWSGTSVSIAGALLMFTPFGLPITAAGAALATVGWYHRHHTHKEYVRIERYASALGRLDLRQWELQQALRN